MFIFVRERQESKVLRWSSLSCFLSSWKQHRSQSLFQLRSDWHRFRCQSNRHCSTNIEWARSLTLTLCQFLWQTFSSHNRAFSKLWCDLWESSLFSSQLHHQSYACVNCEIVVSEIHCHMLSSRRDRISCTSAFALKLRESFQSKRVSRTRLKFLFLLLDDLEKVDCEFRWFN